MNTSWRFISEITVHFLPPATKLRQGNSVQSLCSRGEGGGLGGVSVQGVSVWGGFTVQGGSLTRGSLFRRGSLSRGVSVQGVSVWGVYVWLSLSRVVGSLFRRVSVQGGLCLGESLLGRPPYSNEQAVRILLECILVVRICSYCTKSNAKAAVPTIVFHY